MHFLYNVYFYDRIKTFLLNMYLEEGNISNNIILLFCVVLQLITSVVSLALLYYDR